MLNLMKYIEVSEGIIPLVINYFMQRKEPVVKCKTKSEQILNWFILWIPEPIELVMYKYKV